MSNRAEPIAIIGTGCRFAGDATTPSKLWNLVKDPKDVLTTIPAGRFSALEFKQDDKQENGQRKIQKAYLLAGNDTPRRFDARFFSINQAEANTMDPQIRLLLETVYEAIEAAGLTIEGLQGSDTAIYAGEMVGDYEHLMLRDKDSIGTYHGAGTSRALMSNRVSYFFDWHGPSMTIDTACSSSLVAVHQAVQQLRSGQSHVAVAAGANLILDPQSSASFNKLRMLSSDGRSRMWDAGANGYARGEGIAAVVLKTLSAAEADGDHIECIIRESGVNQDGKTQGITVPSSAAQVRLIQECYARSGLDATSPADRPQYFEAHGTGTQAGDPVEAEAISSAFFPGQGEIGQESERLFVGGIKTVIGHTEGAAGLAALLKASLALQNSTIPPNLLFTSLNKKIEPFYTNLRIPTSATQWPAGSSTRRASVNSFGFGGTNAHAILENYTPAHQSASPPSDCTVLTPFIFSANSETSLTAYLTSFCNYLKTDGADVRLQDLAYTLYARRTRFQISTTFVAATASELCSRIEEKLQKAKKNSDEPLGIRTSRQASDSEKPVILGVFTGQGAQWARMGHELLANCPTAHKIIKSLESRLSQLPYQDRPTWSLMEELQKDAPESRVGQAEFSQPLCTAVQILQVDMLRAAGVNFTTVVGHSSGEIGAAYAAGRISAEDAICIAYYRGRFSHLAQGSKGQAGAMMAVETSFEDIQELCESPDFKGRVCVAAVNSPTSMTVSGDEDAVKEMQMILEDEKKFARLLKVDKAYHSHHVNACSKAYLAALSALNIQVQPAGPCVWFSSVHECDMASKGDTLAGQYWDDNLTHPVLFMQAVQLVCSYKKPSLAIEVGPHPALQSPALQTIRKLFSNDIPYTGLLRRGKAAIGSVADGLGYVSSHLGRDSVNFQAYEKFLSGSSRAFEVVKGLPPYAWDHENEYWHESRYARAERSRPGTAHMLLGYLTPDSTGQEMRWRRILRLSELQWLKGHQLQGQVVFPAAGYVTLALEAGMLLSTGCSVRLIDVADLEIIKALTFDNDEASVEALFSLSNIEKRNDRISAEFKYYAANDKPDSSLELLACGNLRVSLGEPSTAALPARGPVLPNLLKVEADEFYAYMQKLDYQYSGPFVALDKLERKLGAATGYINNPGIAGLLTGIHPAILDAAFQSIFLAQSVPHDGAIWALHVPRTLRNVRINPSLCASEFSKASPLQFDSTQPPGSPAFAGDVEIYPDGLAHAMVQVEGLACVPLAGVTAKDDREMFSTTIWDVANPDAELVTYDHSLSADTEEMMRQLERTSVFYLRVLDRDIPRNHPSRSQGEFTSLFKLAAHVLTLARELKLRLWKQEWENDTLEQVLKATEPYSDVVDFKLIHAIGPNLSDIAKGVKQAIEIGMEDNLLSQYYENSFDMSVYTKYMARAVKQIVHRHPHMNVLEVGAGTGSATKKIFKDIGHSFASYTYTDISSGFFEQARDVFGGQHYDMMHFKVLDIEKDPRTQGFAEHSYDLVVASMVLHATTTLETTLRNVRRLLKPGGYLVAFEGIPETIVRHGAAFGAFPGWWAGADDGRVLSPLADLAVWDQKLRNVGFSGCDSATSDLDPMIHGLTVFVSQAVDNKISFLRDPLSLSEGPSAIEDLLILGGKTLRTSRVIGELKTLMRHHCLSITTERSLTDLASLKIRPTTTIISLMDLDEPFFRNVSNSGWEALKEILQQVRSLLWVTHGRRSENPHANITAGLVRPALREIPTLDVQFLDFEDSKNIKAQMIAETVLRFKAASLWQREGAQETMLNTIEPELVVDKYERVTIPRIKMNQEMNDRYNASRRSILSNLNLETQAVKLCPVDSAYILRQQSVIIGNAEARDLHVSHSLLHAVRVAEFGCMYLLLGRDRNSNEQRITLSSNHSSVISFSKDLSVPATVSPGSEAVLLLQIALQLVATSILKDLGNGDQVVVYDPTPTFASVLSEKAKPIGVQVKFTTSLKAPEASGWLELHSNAPERLWNNAGLEKTSVFVDLSSAAEDHWVSGRIRSYLSTHCRRETLQTLFNKNAWEPWGSHIDDIRGRLEQAVQDAQASTKAAATIEKDVKIVAASAFPASATDLTPQSIVDWSPSTSVSVNIERAESQLKFSESKSYWLAGLSRGLGLSLCEWMVRRGAKYVVISSRSPVVNQAWLSSMSALGAVVKVIACDVTNMADVRKVHSEICSNMPPVGGVAQGAMVLQDTQLRDMSHDNLLRVTRPKVEGSINLDTLFKDSPLDFFVFFSSATMVIGNPGQSNYAAANAFMCSLAEQRRKRGQAASVINIGPILGVGYLAQQDMDLSSQAESGGYTFISESDFHQLFAEAVLAGRPGGSTPIEITTGLTRINAHDKVQPVWAANPLMSHYIKNYQVMELGKGDSKSKVSVKSQLAEARGKQEVFNIIRDAFIPKLCAHYQLNAEKVAQEDLSTLHLDAMGTDSLLAIELRGWFLKTIQVNIPVLKILSGITVAGLLSLAADTIPASLVPNLQVDEEIFVTNTAPPVPTPLAQAEDVNIPVREFSQSNSTVGEDTPSEHSESQSEPEDSRTVSSAPSTYGPVDQVVTKPVKRRTFERTAKLSFGQAMFWFVLTFMDDMSSLNHTGSFRLTGTIRLKEFEHALQLITQKHEILRTCFFEEDGEPRQGIMETSLVQGEYRQISDEKEVAQAVEELEGYSFDLAEGETLRVIVLSLTPTTHYLVMGTPGIIMDGWSFQVFIKDLEQLYTNSANHHYDTLQFMDHSIKQHQDFTQGEFDNDLRYWRDELTDFPPTLPILHLGKVPSRPVLKTYENERVDLRIQPETKKRVQALCRIHKVTPFHFYLAAFRALLVRHADAEDVSIGIGEANRGEDMMGSIGPFVNLLPLRFRTQVTQTFQELLSDTRRKAYAALEHSKVPFQVLLNELDPPRSATTTPIFQSFVDYRLGQRETTSWADCKLEMLSFQASKLAYDLALDIIDDPDGDCIIMLIVRSDLYSKQDAERLVKSYERLVNAFAAQPSAVLSEPEAFDHREIEQALDFGRGASRPRQWPQTMIHRVDEISQKQPNDIAVRWSDGNPVTYRDILSTSDVIAGSLRAAGIQSGARVVVLQEPTPGWISSILAIMRIGAVYVPLDQSHSWSRLATVTRDCQPSLILVDEDTREHVDKLGAPDLQVINVSALKAEGNVSKQEPITVSATDAATILYTSGSSGTPKGIVLKHEGLRNWFESTQEVYGLGDNEQVLQQSSPAFDMSLIQIFTALCLGGTVYLVPKRLRGDAHAIGELIHSEKITYTFACVSELAAWLKYGRAELFSSSAWKTAITGGEPGVSALLPVFASLKKNDLRLFHAYGPTETSFTAATMELFYNSEADISTTSIRNIPVGYVIPNYTVYIVDEFLKPVPPGVQGEIYIGGPGVAANYLNNQGLSSERFVLNRFAMPGELSNGWGSMHRTGDLGRWREEDGALFIEGRISGDTQVKLRGLRIDLREIESALVKAAEGAISDAVVTVRKHTDDNASAFLAAHVVFNQAYAEKDRNQLLSTLKSRLDLPRYMVPAVVVALDQLLLTTTSKLDRLTIAALPLPEGSQFEDVELTDAEAQLKAIWEEVIPDKVVSLHRIGRWDDFFHVGGTSLLLLRLRARIREVYDVQLQLSDMFVSSTLASMARRIEGEANQHHSQPNQIDWEAETQLTPALLRGVATARPIKEKQGRTVILTGATGYLGKGLLQSLIANQEVETVHCIGVRHAQSRQELLGLEKVMLYEGDLLLPRLGLSKQDAEAIFSTADLIIHNGADVSYMKTYASLRRPNVQATKELAEMSLPRLIPFHYISSGGACSFAAAAGSGKIGPVSVAGYRPPPTEEHGAYGYPASKWASEVFLENLHAQFGTRWPVWIHRPSNIARIDTPELDLIFNLRRYSLLLRAVPVARGKVKGKLNSVTLDTVVHGVVNAAIQNEVKSSPKVRFLHHLGDVELQLEDFKTWATTAEKFDDEKSQQERGDVEETTFEDWARRAGEIGMHPSLVGFLQSIKDRKMLVFPTLVKDGEVS